MTTPLLALAVASAALSGFPRDAGGRISHAAVGATLGGAPAVLVPAGDHVAGFRGDGSGVPGFPLSLGAGEVAAGPVAVADGGGGRPEIAAVTASGRVLRWGAGLAPGFPVELGAGVRAGPAFADVDGDGRPELVVGDARGRVHAFKDGGREAAGWPVSVGAPVTSAASSASFGGGRAVAVGCEDGKVHVLDGKGRERPGFPVATRFAVTGAPAFADLDDDGELDLVVGSQDYAVYAVDARGKALPGFPVRAGYRIYEGVAVADVDGDRRLDVVFASADGMLHAVSARGEPLPGFPVRVGTRLFSGPAVGDLDRDGVLDVVVVAADGAVVAVTGKGASPVAGFPVSPGAADVAASPLLLDATGDGLAVLVGLPTGALHAVRAERMGAARPVVAWAGPGRDAARSGRAGPNAPTFKDLALAPEAPRVADALRARWRAVWLDAGPGEAPPAPRIEWLRDGAHVPALDGRQELPAGTARRGERWRFVLTAAAAPGDRWESPEVTVLDTAPGAAVLALEPAVPDRAADVRAVVRRPAPDADGDAVTYAWSWLLDGLDTGVTGDRLPAARLRRGALLTVRAVASDGALSGPEALAQARVADTAPGPARISLEPAQPGRADAVRVRVDAPAVDPDGDPVAYRHRWTVDGAPRDLPAAAAALPGALFRKHQRIEVEVRPSDGTLDGPAARASVVAVNTPPTAPRVELRPLRPRRGEPLRVSVVAPSDDVDGDAVTYQLAWRKNGAPFAGAVAGGREIPGSEVAKGDRFEVTVTPHDGEAAGVPATAAVMVGNTSPAPPRITVEPGRPRGGDTLRLVVVEPARDVDGDKVSLAVAWTRDGKPTGGREETLGPSRFRKHERVRVVVTPHDGEDSGAPAAVEVEVDDAPPTAPVVAFTAERPTVATPLQIEVRTPATDADGDPLRYEYRWSRDGEPVALPDGTEASRAPPYWTAASEVPANQLRKGQRWAVEVRAHDGEQAGPAARVATTIANTPPPALRFAFAPERPRRVDGITVVLDPLPDADGDRVTYRHAWTRDGKRVDVPADQGQIPRGLPRRGERWAVEVVANDGEADGPPVRREVVVADTAPGAAAVALCDGPVPAGTVPEVRVTAAATDPDGDAVSYRHAWSVNGKPVAAMQGQPRLAAPALRKHDVVRVVVTPWDGELAGPAAHGECLVANTPPTAPQIALEPPEPTAARGVAVVLRAPASDRDGDAVQYRYAWFRDGVRTSHDGPAIPPAVLRHGEVWRVVVTPFDGEEAGAPATASAVVRNTPPAAPSVVLVPASPVTGEAVVCDARAPERDADQEVVAIRHRWHRDGQPVAVGEGLATLPARTVRRGERWRCEAWATDGVAESGHAFAEIVVRNSPPGAPKVVVEPEAPRKGDDLACRIELPAVDLDDDAVSYGYAWTRNGRPVTPGTDPARVEGARVVRGDRWRCTVTPTDGTTAGAPASAERVVANTPPGPAVVRLEPAAPRAGEAVRCVIVTRSEDPDGDPVRYRFSWQRDGVAQPFADTSQDVPARLVRAGDRWRCSVTPTDGSEDGPVAGTEELAIGPRDDQGGAAPASLSSAGRAVR
jgi:hypothetical protein